MKRNVLNGGVRIAEVVHDARPTVVELDIHYPCYPDGNGALEGCGG